MFNLNNRLQDLFPCVKAVLLGSGGVGCTCPAPGHLDRAIGKEQPTSSPFPPIFPFESSECILLLQDQECENVGPKDGAFRPVLTQLQDASPSSNHALLTP